jgi:hypothetical protein
MLSEGDRIGRLLTRGQGVNVTDVEDAMGDATSDVIPNRPS